MAATSASVALSSAWALIRPLNCGGAPGIADGSSPVRPAFSIAGPLMRGISTGSCGSNSSGTRPETSILAVPQFAANRSTSASPLSIRARRTMSEKPGSSNGERTRPLSTVSISSGSICLRVPRSEPVNAIAPSLAMLVCGGA